MLLTGPEISYSGHISPYVSHICPIYGPGVIDLVRNARRNRSLPPSDLYLSPVTLALVGRPLVIVPMGVVCFCVSRALALF